MLPANFTPPPSDADPRVLSGNDPLVLDGRDAWRVKSGSVAVFLRSKPKGRDIAERRYLFTIVAGDTILWRPAGADRIVSAVPVEPSELVPTSFDDEASLIASGDADAARRFANWIEALAAEIREAGGEPLPAPAPVASVEGVLNQLASCQAEFLGAIDKNDEQRERERRDRFQERQVLNRRLASETLADLASISVSGAARPADTALEAPLLAAARRVGDASGVVIRAPEVSIQTRSALEGIIEASSARSRKVLLTSNWWKRTGGPLLGFLQEGTVPVALIPEQRRLFGQPRYHVIAADGTETVVDDAVAATISPNAYVFYPALPDRVSPFDLLMTVMRPHTRAFVIAISAGVGTALLGMLTPQATKILFESAVPDGDRALLWQIGAALIAAAAGGLLFDLTQAVGLVRLLSAASTTMQVGVWDRVLKLSPSFFRRFTAGDLSNRAESVIRIRFVLNETVLTTVLGSIVALLNLGLMFIYSVSLALVALVIAVLIFVVNIISARQMLRAVKPLQETEGQLTGMMVQLINAVSKLRTAGAETRAFAQWGRTYGRKVKLKQDQQTITDRVRLMGLVVPPAATAVLFWVAYGNISTGGTLTLGAFVAFSLAFGTFLTAATTLGDTMSTLLNATAMWDRLKPILEAQPEVDAQQNSPGVLSGRILVDHVTFRYRDDGPLTLDNVTIKAEPGECIALVGPSGSGKSTIINLLLRFETPLSGAVYFDDHDLSGLDVLAIRRQLGVVTQENKILAGSIYDNIACGSLATMDHCWDAARAAGLDEDIKQMPMGMHTFIAEGGGNISGGQRQRLLIARALLQKPRVVILDEATSALDNRTQAIVTDSLNKLKVTRILVAHRLSTIRQADRIYVIQGGRVVQQGTFNELLAQDGLFARSMQRQIA